MTYKEEIIKEWLKAGGLIPKNTAAKILGVSASVITKRKDIKRYKVKNDEYVSFSEIIGREDVVPRKKRSTHKVICEKNIEEIKVENSGTIIFNEYLNSKKTLKSDDI